MVREEEQNRKGGRLRYREKQRLCFLLWGNNRRNDDSWVIVLPSLGDSNLHEQREAAFASLSPSSSFTARTLTSIEQRPNRPSTSHNSSSHIFYFHFSSFSNVDIYIYIFLCGTGGTAVPGH